MENNQPITEPSEGARQPIFTAELVKRDGKNTIEMRRYGAHIPTLSYIKDWLHSEIMELIVQEKIKQEIAANPQIVAPNREGLLKYLRSRRNGK